MLGMSSANLTKRIRFDSFKAMLRQDIGWFDQPENNVGRLCTKIEMEASMCQGATGVTVSNLFMNVANFAFSLALAFYYNWIITSLIAVFVPFTVLFSVLEEKLIESYIKKDKLLMEEAARVSSSSVRTFLRQRQFYLS